MDDRSKWRSGAYPMKLKDAMKEVQRLRAIVRKYEPQSASRKKRAPHNSVKNAILTYANAHDTFTAEDLVKVLPQNKNNLRASLRHLMERGLLRRKKVGHPGKHGSVSVYVFRGRR